VKFQPRSNAAAKALVRANVAASAVHVFRSKAEHWKLAPGTSVEEAIERLRANPLVEHAEPKFALSADGLPDDSCDFRENVSRQQK
jgi:predicted Fe-Mo cluster-binding NifX family protein